MFSGWFSKKTKDPVSRPGKAPATTLRVPEPKRPALDRGRGRPPADSDREFVYHER
jgi:hypothetical protein